MVDGLVLCPRHAVFTWNCVCMAMCWLSAVFPLCCISTALYSRCALFTESCIHAKFTLICVHVFKPRLLRCFRREGTVEKWLLKDKNNSIPRKYYINKPRTELVIQPSTGCFRLDHPPSLALNTTVSWPATLPHSSTNSISVNVSKIYIFMYIF